MPSREFIFVHNYDRFARAHTELSNYIGFAGLRRRFNIAAWNGGWVWKNKEGEGKILV